MVKRCCTLFFLILVSANFRCSDDSDDKLTFTRTTYEGDALRFDGYYYRTYSNGDIEIYFLFRNGNVLYGTYVMPANLSWLESTFSNGTYYTDAKNDKPHWGVFLINGNSIKYERWIPANGMGSSPVYQYIGTILNDTTFQTHSYYRVGGTDENAYNHVFKFKQFSPKPDSICPFIP